MTRHKFGFEYLYLFYLLFSMGRTLRLSRTTLLWNTRRRANQQAWWRIRNRYATSTTGPGTRSPSTLTLIMVSMQWHGLSIELTASWELESCFSVSSWRVGMLEIRKWVLNRMSVKMCSCCFHHTKLHGLWKMLCKKRYLYCCFYMYTSQHNKHWSYH